MTIMQTTRRQLIAGLGGTLALPALESLGAAAESAKTRFLVVGNPFGAHPDYFFPKDFGPDFAFSKALKSLEWLRGRLTVFSHTDHNMVSGHGREVAFLSGVLPADAATFPEKNMSLDQLFARHTGAQVRFPSVEAGLEAGAEACSEAGLEADV